MYKHFWSYFKQLVSEILLVCLVSQALGIVPCTAWAGEGIRAVHKDDVGWDDVDEVQTMARKSNVLFLIEASEVMSFTSRGVQPYVWRDAFFDTNWEEAADWPLTEKNFGYTIHDINRMMYEATFGMGSLPPAWRGMDLRQGRNLYGRDRRKENNFKKGKNLEETIALNKDNYYFPFADQEYSKQSLAGLYDGQTTPLEIGYKNYMDIWPDNIVPSQYRYIAHGPAGYDMGHYGDACRHINTVIHNVGPKLSGFDAIDYYGKELPIHGVDYNGEPVLATDWDYKSSVRTEKAYPYALVFKDPKYWAEPPSSWTEDDLVPNDSRMYQTKLVLWNLLNDRNMFKNLRVGMATTFLSPANLERSVQQRSLHQHGIAWDQNPDTNGVFKVFPFGANIRTKSYFDEEGHAYMNKSVPVNKWKNSEYVYSRRNPPMLKEMLGDGYPITLSNLKKLQESIKIDYKSGSVTHDYDKGFNKNIAQDGKLYSRVRYANGTMRGSTTGEVEAFIHVHGQSYPLWHNYVTHAGYMTQNDDGTEPDGWWSNGAVPALDTAIPDEGPGPGGREYDNLPLLFDLYNNSYTNAKNKSYRSAGEIWDRPVYKLMHRGSLWLPIVDSDYVWEKGGKKIDQIEKFKLWINGVADIKSAGRTVDTTWVESTWDNVTDGLGAGSSSNPNPAGDKRTQSNRDNQFHWYNDPEIGVSGQFGLAQAIFPDPTEYDYTPGHRNQKLELNAAYYRKKGYVWYSKRDVNINYNYDFRRNSQEYDATAYPRARFNRGSGEAAGSVLDFFSPKIDYSFKGSNVARDGDYADYMSTSLAQIWDTKGSHTIATTDLHKVSFPIRASCEDNWVILIASGAEPKIMKDSYTYHCWEAIKNLYDATDKDNKGKAPSGGRKTAYEPVTRIKPKVLLNAPTAGTEGGRAFTRDDLEEIDLDKPIRTLVVGIVAHPDDPDVKDNKAVRDEVIRMRENLNKMARAGQGKDINDDSVNAFFADDVPSLMTAIQNAIMFIETHEEQTGKGKMLETPAASDILNQDSSQYDFYYSSFRIRRDNVWEGYLTRFKLDETKEEGLKVEKVWELNDKLLGRRNGSQGTTWRNLRRWDGTSFVRIPQNDSGFASFTGLLTENMSDANLPVSDPFGSHSAAASFYGWLNGYDHSYRHGKDYKRANMLADLGQQGVAMVGDPPIGMGPPGYTAWTQKRNLEANRQEPVIYLQSNDGLLHAVDPENGDEKMAVIPPPMLLPSRMATTKTLVYGGGKLNWIDVDTGESNLQKGDVSAIRANPVYLLDGALISRRLSNNDGSQWHTYLFGALGRGGKGLYALNADSYSAPRLLWYKEKVGTNLASMTEIQSVPSFSAPAQGSLETFWMKLGLNSPKPAIGVTGSPEAMRNFIALAGGFDEAADMSQNGRDGAVLMFIDPKDGSVIRGFGSGEVDHSMRIGSGETGSSPYMGMMVSEPTLLSSAQGSEYAPYLTGAVYAADNRGSIFSVEMEREEPDTAISPVPLKEWKLRTLATLQSNQELSSQGGGNSYAIPHGVTAVRKDDSIWLAGGTADIAVTRTPKYLNGKLENASQMIFSFKTEKSQTDVYTRNDLKVLKASGNDVYIPGDPERGWMINLEDADKNAGKSAEYVSAKPLVTGGVIYIPTFVEKRINVTDPNTLCDISPRTYGEARLYAVYVDSGARYWGEAVGRFTSIGGIKITGFSVSTSGGKRRIVATYDNLTGQEPAIDDGIGATNVRELSSFLLDAPVQSAVNMKPGQDMIYYWLKE
jgi:hypothetical protein